MLDLLPERIAAKIEVTESGCWTWAAATTRNGYGLVKFDGGMRVAHRVVYTLLVGEIPEGLQIDHLCRVRHCVNPEHLEPVTQRENLLRGDTVTARNATVTHCPAGHPYDEVNTYRRPGGGRFCRACGNEQSRRQRQRSKDD